jgi:ABC-type dipeptide/oligopeptide/nickel transport system ATPase component
MSAPMLRIQGLRLSAGGHDIVRGVTLYADAGEITGIVGESGSGKSQTALAIAGLNGRGIKRVEGRIWCDGEDLSALTAAELAKRRGRKLAYVFQDPMSALNPTKRIGVQIEDVLKSARPDTNAVSRRRETLAMLDAVGLDDPHRVLRAYPFELSGGMRQRILIALAYALRPALIVADEPTTALDVTLQAKALALIASLQTQHRCATLFISHDLAVVAQICARIYVMRAGEIVEEGACADILAAPRHEYTRSLIEGARAKEKIA